MVAVVVSVLLGVCVYRIKQSSGSLNGYDFTQFQTYFDEHRRLRAEEQLYELRRRTLVAASVGSVSVDAVPTATSSCHAATANSSEWLQLSCFHLLLQCCECCILSPYTVSLRSCTHRIGPISFMDAWHKRCLQALVSLSPHADRHVGDISVTVCFFVRRTLVTW